MDQQNETRHRIFVLFPLPHHSVQAFCFVEDPAPSCVPQGRNDKMRHYGDIISLLAGYLSTLCWPQVSLFYVLWWATMNLWKPPLGGRSNYLRNRMISSKLPTLLMLLRVNSMGLWCSTRVKDSWVMKLLAALSWPITKRSLRGDRQQNLSASYIWRLAGLR